MEETISIISIDFPTIIFTVINSLLIIGVIAAVITIFVLIIKKLKKSK